MIRAETTSRLILAILEAVETPARWQVFLDGFTAALNSNQSALMVWTQDHEHNGIACYSGATEHDRREFLDKWVDQDPWMTRAPHDLPEGVFVRSNDLTPDDVLEQTEMYRQYLQPRGWHYGGAVILLRSPSLFSLLSTTRAKEKGPLTEDECGWIRGLIPYLRTAVRLHENHSRITTERDVSRAYLDQLAHGLAIIGHEGHLLFANRRMQAMISAADGIKISNHRFTLEGEVGRELRTWLKDAAAGAAIQRQFAVERPSRRRAYWMTLAPGSGPGAVPLGGVRPIAAVTIVDPETRALPEATALAAMFGLTPAECRFARLLAGGSTAQEAAVTLKISPHTAKTHLKRILSKTGARRQSEMISVLLSIGAPGRE